MPFCGSWPCRLQRLDSEGYVDEAGRAVRDPEGRPIAGISVAASTERMTKQRQRWIAGLMKDALDAAGPLAGGP